MKISEFDFSLPEELIAQHPLKERSSSKMLVLNRRAKTITHSFTKNLPEFLDSGDVVVINNSKVIPARLFGKIQGRDIHVEFFLTRKIEPEKWTGLINPGKKASVGDRIIVKNQQATLEIEVLEKLFDGQWVVKLSSSSGVAAALEAVGHMPLPPYIKRADNVSDKSRYQTVFAQEPGSIAAPTAGLHFTQEVLDRLKNKGIQIAPITLHVGYGTFKPVRVENIEEHKVDQEFFTLPEESVEIIKKALNEGRRIVAVGTTSTRTLESIGPQNMHAQSGSTDLFIHPGYDFQVISGLLTNFHLPKSSLFMLVCAFAGKDLAQKAYREAIENKYRFYSYGDAMLIL